MSQTQNQPMNRQQRRAMERQMAKLASQRRTSQVEGNAVARREQSTLRKHLASPSLAPQEVERGIAVLERLDGMSGLRNGLRKIAASRREWAGIPMCLDTHDLVIEPTYPNAEALMASLRPSAPLSEDGFDPGDVKVRNRFWSSRYRRWLWVYEDGDKIRHGLDAEGPQQVSKMIHTLGASDAWGIEQEKNAVDTLGGLLRHRQFKQYLLTGMFLERSARSGVHYLFRRLRPTVAITENGRNGMKVLAALCLHPIGYYAESWAGAMTPTDDVIAHLMLMRGDEHMFWRRANQHPAWDPNAGIV